MTTRPIVFVGPEATGQLLGFTLEYNPALGGHLKRFHNLSELNQANVEPAALILTDTTTDGIDDLLSILTGAVIERIPTVVLTWHEGTFDVIERRWPDIEAKAKEENDRRVARAIELGHTPSDEDRKNPADTTPVENIEARWSSIRTILTVVSDVSPGSLDPAAIVALAGVADEVLAPPTGASGTVAPVGKGSLFVFTSDKGGSGKCLAGETLIADPVTGLRQTIEDLVLRSDTASVAAFDGRFISPHRINDKIYSGAKETFTVRTRSGREIRATATHPLLTTSGWVPLSEVMAGETLAVPARMPHPAAPQRMNSAELDLLALLMAEGGTSTPATNFTNFDPSIIELAANAAEALGMQVKEMIMGEYGRYRITGGVKVGADIPAGICQCGCGAETQPAKQKYADYETGEPQRFVRGHHKRETVLRRLRREHGLDFVLAKNKTMPEAVYRLPADQLARFISLFWMCDGYVVDRKKGGSGGEVGVTLASKALVESLQHLLLRFGVISKVSYRVAKCNGKEFDAWRLTVYSSSYSAFQASFSLWGNKGDNLAALARAAEEGHNPNVGSPTFTDAVYGRLMAYNTPGLPKRVADKLEWKIDTPISPSMVLTHRATKRTGRKHLNLPGLRHWAGQAGAEAEAEFGWIYDSEIFWDEIESITPNGVEPVYDIEVPGPHNFVANDIVVHNSTSALMFASAIAGLTSENDKPLTVCLVDIDRKSQLRSRILNVPERTGISMIPENANLEDIRNALVPFTLSSGEEFPGLFALIGGDNTSTEHGSLRDSGVYQRTIPVLRDMFDVVVVDSSVDIREDGVAAWTIGQADKVFYVIDPDPASMDLTDSAASYLMRPREAGGFGLTNRTLVLVANRVPADEELRDDYLARIHNTFTPPVSEGGPGLAYVELPDARDELLRAQVEHRVVELFQTSSELARPLRSFARRAFPEIIAADGNNPPPKRSGLFRK